MLRYARALVAFFFLFSLAVSAKAALEPDRGLLDFGAFYMAGVVQEEGLDNPYGVYPDLAAATGENFGHGDDRGHSPNLNPPISLYPFRLLANADAEVVKTALNIVSGVIFVGCAVAMLRAYPEHRTVQGVLWIAAFGGFWYTLWLGQIYLLLFAAGLGAWFLIQRGTNPLLAGVLLGLLVAVKPHFVLWPLFLLLAGHPRIALSALATAAMISAVPLMLRGPEVYQLWLEAARDYPRLAYWSNASLIGQAERIGLPDAGLALGLTLIAATGLLMYFARPNALKASSWGIVVALLAAPIAWIGYGLLLMPVLLSRRWQALEWAAAISMTGLWFALARGEPFLGASLMLLVMLSRDQLVHRELARTVTEAHTQASHREQIAPEPAATYTERLHVHRSAPHSP